MAKKLGLVNPAQLWGKPLRSAAPQKAEGKVTGTMTPDEDVTEDEIDVDAELANEDAAEDELHAIEAESETEVTAAVETDDPDEEDADDDEPEYADDDDSDVSDQTEDAVEDDEEVVTAVADENEEEDGVVETPATTRKSSMAEKMSLSDHIRGEIERRQKSGDSLRGVDIVGALAKRKIEVSAAQVSQLLKKAGLGGKPRGGKKAPVAVAVGEEKSRAASRGAKREVDAAPAKPKATEKFAAKRPAATNNFRVPMDQLKAAEAFVEACGGSFQSAERILTAAAQLSQTFGG